MTHVTDRIRLLVLYGGRSAEHEVSRVSGRYVAECARAAGFEVELVGITRGGRWVRPAAVPEGPAGTGGSLPAFGDDLPAVPVDGALERPDGGELVVFPVLHGPFGEDGTVQGLCEMAGAAYVGPGVLSSAVCMDKPVSKRLLEAAGLPVARHVALRSGDVTAQTPAALLAELGSPVFVKPANMGSSIGVSKAAGAGEVAAALSLAAAYDDRLIAEEFVAGREIEVSVLGNKELRASLPGEIVPGGEFYDYADKYLNDARRAARPRRPSRRRHRRGTAPRHLRRPGALRGGVGAGGLPLRRGRRARAAPRRQRDQHHARIHPHLHVPPPLGRLRPRRPGRSSPSWSNWPSTATTAAPPSRAEDIACSKISSPMRNTPPSSDQCPTIPTWLPHSASGPCVSTPARLGVAKSEVDRSDASVGQRVQPGP